MKDYALKNTLQRCIAGLSHSFHFVIMCFFLFLISCDITFYPNDSVDSDVNSHSLVSTQTDNAEIEVEIALSGLKVVLRDDIKTKTIHAIIENDDIKNLSYMWFVCGEVRKDGENAYFTLSEKGEYQVDCRVSGIKGSRNVSGMGHLVVKR